MRSRYSWHQSDAISGRLADRMQKESGQVMADFIADVIRVKGAGRYKIAMAFPSRRNFYSDLITMELEALRDDFMPLAVPYPYDWSLLGEWAHWWTVDMTGQVRWHQLRPQWMPHLGRWVSEGRTGGNANDVVDIPLGVDWRTLIFERPSRMMQRGGPLVADASANGKPADFDSANGGSTPPASFSGPTATSWWRRLLP